MRGSHSQKRAVTGQRKLHGRSSCSCFSHQQEEAQEESEEESQDQQGPVSKEEERSEGVRSVASAAPVATAPAAAPQPQAAPSKREQQQQHQQQHDARGRKAAQYAWVGPQVHEQQAMATAARLHEQTAVIAQKRQEKKVRRMNRPPHQFCLKLLFIHRFLCI